MAVLVPMAIIVMVKLFTILIVDLYLREFNYTCVSFLHLNMMDVTIFFAHHASSSSIQNILKRTISFA
jgi:hypothetical protein